MTMLQAITFDLDDTLWDNHGVMARTEEGHYRWLLTALEAWRAARHLESAVFKPLLNIMPTADMERF